MTPVHNRSRAAVILSAAKDLVWKCDPTEILRYAQDDGCFAGL